MKEIVNANKAMLKKNNRKQIWRHRELYLFMLPGLIALIIFKYGPMYGVLMAFQDVKIGNPFAQNEWVGFYHFIRFFNSNWFFKVIKNTIIISFLTNIVCWPFPILLALMLHNSTNGKIKKVAQMTSYLPHLLSIVVVVSIVNIFCSGEAGLINIVLSKIGLDRINFFGDPDWVRPLYLISDVWAHTGYGAIVYLGALASVDEELIEAARIDGASKLKCIWHIQLPTILPTVVTMLILNLGKMFTVGADKMLLLQTDLNLASSEIISTYVYKVGFVSTQYGFSSAVGLFQNVINLILLLLVNWVAKKLTDVSIL